MPLRTLRGKLYPLAYFKNLNLKPCGAMEHLAKCNYEWEFKCGIGDGIVVLYVVSGSVPDRDTESQQGGNLGNIWVIE